MALKTKDEVLSFLEANRQMLANKTGFKHAAEQFADVATFIEQLAKENEMLVAENEQLTAANNHR
ncbi:MAG: hypothetical protein FWG00_04110 [Coriobacteriia bacterium]|nr:hypothetical protein [Coriobacteriia bacterium]